MLKFIRTWWMRRRLSAAVDLLHASGLYVCRIQSIAGTDYLVKPDGTMMRLVERKARNK